MSSKDSSKNSKDENKKLKEFIKYENGELVSFEKEFKHFDVDDDELFSSGDENNKEKRSEKKFDWTKHLLNKRTIIILATLFFLVFSAYSMGSIYKAFFVQPDGPTDDGVEVVVDDEDYEPATSEEDNNPKKQEGSKMKNLITALNSVLKPDKGDKKPNGDTNDSKVSTNNGSDAKIFQPNSTEVPDFESYLNQAEGESSLEQALRLATSVNNAIVDYNNTEVNTIHMYLDRKTNKIVVENRLEDIISDKEELYHAFISNNALFEDDSLSPLFDATLERLVESLNFSKGVKASLDSGEARTKLQPIAKSFAENDRVIQETQIKAMMYALDENNVPYEYDTFTETISYTIEQDNNHEE